MVTQVEAPVLPSGEDGLPDEDLFDHVPGPRPRRRLGPQSLTSRLVTGVVVLVFVAVTIVCAGTYFFLRSSLVSRLDQQVRFAATQNAAYFQHCYEVSLNNYTCTNPSGPRQQTREWVALLSPTGEQAATLKPGGPLYVLSLTSAQSRQLAADPSRMITVRNGGDELRVTGEVNTAGLLVVTGLSTEDIDRTLSRLVGLEAAIGLAALAVALIATLYGVRFTLGRLRRVTSTAREVAAELSPQGAGLDRRVPSTDDDTEVGQLATSFNTMLAAVQTQFAARVESEQRMRQFLADASHELRTPLTSIRGYAELARMQRAVGDTSANNTSADNTSPDTSADNLDRIESEGTRMSRLVEDLLTLARGDADGGNRPQQRELVDVAGLVDDAVSGSRAAFGERDIRAAVHADPHVIGDRDQLLRVVRNLINNAAVHTAADRPIEVRAFADGDWVRVQVIDGGPGLPPEDAARVFERFWRADKARTRVRGGSGLGLSIVDTMVGAHGGTVRFDSTVETGSTVTVSLPAAHPAAE